MNPIVSIRSLMVGAFALIAMAPTGCDLSTTTARGGADDTHTGIVDIQGRVLTKDALPYGNVIVHLRGLNLLDTTDSNGKFQFVSETAIRAQTGSAVDTVDYLRDGQVILSTPVPSWISTLPDVMLVQRDLSGSVHGKTELVSKVSCEMRLPDGTMQRIDLEWNSVLKTFSGFSYFRYNGGIDSFSAVAQTRDDSDRLLGQSATVKFTSRAGDIAFPSFKADDAISLVDLRPFRVDSVLASRTTPRIESGDSMIATPGDTIRIFAEAYNNIKQFRSLEWNLDGQNWIRSSQFIAAKFQSNWPGSRGPIFDTLVTVPANLRAGSTWLIRARVKNMNGLWSEDTLRVAISLSSLRSAAIWLAAQQNTPSDGFAPGTPVSVTFSEDSADHRRVLSRKLYIGRATRLWQTTISSGSCVYIDTIYLGWGSESPSAQPISSCADLPLHWSNELITYSPVGAGISVSGRDTIITLPDSTGEYKLFYELVGSNGDTLVVRSNLAAVRNPSPRIDSVVASSDSLILHWSPSPTSHCPENSQSNCRWSLILTWGNKMTSESTVYLTGNARSIGLHPRSDERSVRVQLREIEFGIESFSADTIFASLPNRTLTFSGSIADSKRLEGNAFWEGGARSVLNGSVGLDLEGEVARLQWFMEESTGTDIAGARFSLPASIGSTALHLDLGNRTNLPCRIQPILEYWGGTAKAASIWDIPAGSVGSLTLPLDPNDLPKHVIGISVSVSPSSDPTLKQGYLELDNLHWQ